MSGTSMGSKGRTRPQMDRSLAFETEKPNGPWRDKVTVDVLKIGEDDFKGTIKLREARDKIYKEAMGLPRGNLHAVEFEFRGHPVITFRLRERVNVDQLFETDMIKFERETIDGTVTIQGKIRGLSLGKETFVKGDMKRVKIKGCKWSIEEEVLEKWLSNYGLLVTPITEEMHRESDEESEEDEEELEQPPLGTGNLCVKMKLDRSIPQFLPIMGRKIEIYYRGVEFICTRCYNHGHKRNDCQTERTDWMEYVKNFIENNENIEPELYGKWVERVADWKQRPVPHKQDKVQPLQTGESEQEDELQRQGSTTTTNLETQPVSEAKNEQPATNVGSYRNSPAYRKNTAATNAVSKQTSIGTRSGAQGGTKTGAGVGVGKASGCEDEQAGVNAPPVMERGRGRRKESHERMTKSDWAEKVKSSSSKK